MRYLFTLLALLTFATPTRAEEFSDSSENCWNDWNPSYFASFSFLRWKPCLSGQDYVMDNSGEGSPAFLHYDTETGYRLTLGASLFGCLGTALEYTDYSADGSHSGTGSYSLTAVPVTSSGIFGKSELDYKTLDFTLGYNICICPEFDLTTFGGVRLLNLDQYWNIRRPSNDLALDWNSELKAVGVLGGLHGHWKICGPWALYGLFSSSLLRGETDTTYTYMPESTPLTGKEDECLGVFGSNVGLGANYSSCFWGILFDLSLGYEAHYWSNIPVMRRFDGNVSTNATGGDLLLHGWNFRIDACF